MENGLKRVFPQMTSLLQTTFLLPFPYLNAAKVPLARIQLWRLKCTQSARVLCNYHILKTGAGGMSKSSSHLNNIIKLQLSPSSSGACHCLLVGLPFFLPSLRRSRRGVSHLEAAGRARGGGHGKSNLRGPRNLCPQHRVSPLVVPGPFSSPVAHTSDTCEPGLSVFLSLWT